MTVDGLHVFATEYTKAWCSQNPARVASFFTQDGSLAINGGAPARGRVAIAESARGFMNAFPDMVVTMDAVESTESGAVYRWTLSGTNSGPGGTGRRVRISGTERWSLDRGGLVQTSIGTFDAADYQRQLEGR